jgi:hypothetical protein
MKPLVTLVTPFAPLALLLALNGSASAQEQPAPSAPPPAQAAPPQDAPPQAPPAPPAAPPQGQVAPAAPAQPTYAPQSQDPNGQPPPQVVYQQQQEEAPPPPAQWVYSYPTGQWVFTSEYGWLWVPAGAATSGADGVPYTYLYTPSYGWNWYVSPWGAGAYHYGLWVRHPWHPVGWRGGWVAHPNVFVRLGGHAAFRGRAVVRGGYGGGHYGGGGHGGGHRR